MMEVDIAVIGAGPGGLSAATAATKSGASVAIIDAYQQLGGQFYRDQGKSTTEFLLARQERGKQLIGELLNTGVTILSETIVWGVFENNNTLALYGEHAPTSMKANKIILATGAYERPIAIQGWKLPGVMTIGGAQSLLRQGILPGKRILIAGTGPMLPLLAAEAADTGVRDITVLEGSRASIDWISFLCDAVRVRELRSEGFAALKLLARHHIPYRTGMGIVSVHGKDQVEGAVIARFDKRWRPISGSSKSVECDAICIGYGFIPSVDLEKLLGVKLEWRDDCQYEVPIRNSRMQTSEPDIYSVGDGAYVGGSYLSQVEGEIAGLDAALKLGHSNERVEKRISNLTLTLKRGRRYQKRFSTIFTPGLGIYELSHDETIICRCEEVTKSEIRRASRIGPGLVSEVKALTRCGMGECGGRLCSHLVAHVISSELGISIDEVGFYKTRPPIFPILIDDICHSAEHRQRDVLER